MKAADFECDHAIKNKTPSGGYINIGVGYLLFEDGRKDQSVGFVIVDGEQNKVAEFALQSDTFGVFLETLKSAFEIYELENNKK